jgi:hypothetical protein
VAVVEKVVIKVVVVELVDIEIHTILKVQAVAVLLKLH